MSIKTTINKNFDGEFSVVIKHRYNVNKYILLEPVVEDGVIWETDRQGSPGKLTFKVYCDSKKDLTFEEGDAVALKYRANGEQWSIVFSGYIFTKKHTKDGWIDVTAYDQLRYFKNKATYVYSKKRASDVVKMIANDYKLNVGNIENTNYVIGERIEDNQTLFDIIQDALDLTLAHTTTKYVVYDNAGKLCLSDVNHLRLDIVINKDVCEDFSYSSSIDDETYNEVELYYDNDETNKREYYHAFDPMSMENWGRLRYTEQVQSNGNAADKVKQLLKYYNRKTRQLKVTGAFGDTRCRAGTMVLVQFDLDDININHYMIVESARHIFSNNEYRMELTLEGFLDETPDSAVTEEVNVVDVSQSEPETETTNIFNVRVGTTNDSPSGRVLKLFYYDADNKRQSVEITNSSPEALVGALKNTNVEVWIPQDWKNDVTCNIVRKSENWKFAYDSTQTEVWRIDNLTEDSHFSIEWVD